MRKSGVDEHYHDLRGTAATKLYLANFSIREIAALMAWEEKCVEGIINRYVRRDEIIRDMVRRLDENDAKTPPAKPVKNSSE